jgi:hypothetical protein
MKRRKTVQRAQLKCNRGKAGLADIWKGQSGTRIPERLLERSLSKGLQTMFIHSLPRERKQGAKKRTVSIRQELGRQVEAEGISE